jgi:hypothetical protein
MEGNYEVMPGICPWWDAVKTHAERAPLVDTRARRPQR